jgi:hypothetical protein
MNVLPDPQTRDEILGYHGAVSDFKRRLIEATLHQALGNRTHAARTLGLQRTYLLRLMRELRVAAPPPPSRTGRMRTDGVAHHSPEAGAPSREAPGGRADRHPRPLPVASTGARSPSPSPASSSTLIPPSRPPARAAGHGTRRLSR